MKMNEFKKFIIEKKICSKYKVEPIFVRFSINKQFNFYKFELAINEIARGEKTTAEDLLKNVLKPFEEKEKEKEKEKNKEKKKEIVMMIIQINLQKLNLYLKLICHLLINIMV